MSVSVRLLARSHRLHLWPIILATAAAMSLGAGYGGTRGVQIGLVLALTASFGFVVNDLWDRRADTANVARRLESANLVTRTLAAGSAILFLITAIMLARRESPEGLSLALWVSAGLILYTALLRRVLLAGTMTAAVLGTAPVWAPLVLWRAQVSAQWTIVWAMVILLAGREIMLDVKDVVGDREVGRRSVPSVFGPRVAVWTTLVLHVAASSLFLVAIWDLAVLSSFSRRVAGLALAAAFVAALLLPLLAVVRQGASWRLMRSYLAGSYVAMGLLPIILWLTLQTIGGG